MVRRVTLVQIMVVVNGRKRRIVAERQPDIISLLQDRTPLGEYLRNAVDDLMDVGDSIDDGNLPSGAPTHEVVEDDGG